ncbi:MAG: ARMT1-like domain-containing protein [Acidilobaceae archaeon]
MKASTALLGVLEKSATRTEVFTESFKLMYPLVREEIEKLKRALNEKFLDILYEVRGESWRSLLTLSALANAVDYEMKWSSVSTELVCANSGECGIVDSDALDLLEDSEEVAILLDNAGEAVVDLALALKLAASGKRVLVIARGEPYEVDVTAGEARELAVRVAERIGEKEALRKIVVLSTESSYPAFAATSNSVLSASLSRVDAIVSKGIANFEAAVDYEFPESGKVIVALRAKCPPIAELLGAPLGAPVIRILSRIRAERWSV